ncbi:MAG: glycosyltransferase family 25 protein, partial [Planctomycetaceae bacterium]|nr:glycosyltransferase family 25 protein [Planctomycetaceae bacterium]
RRERLDVFFHKLPPEWPFRFPERFLAIDGGLVTPPDWWNGGGGAWGCYKAHLRILEDCLNHEYNSVLIFEDDAVCVDGFGEKIQKFWDHLPDDWEMVYLGGQHIQENQRLPRKINEWVYHPYNVNRCHCYGFRGRKMLAKAYKHLNNFFDWKVDHHVDHYLGELHKRTEKGFYCPKEWLVAQSEGQSDICGADLEVRLFPGAEETVFPVLDRPCCAVVGNYFSGINTVTGAMKELGLFLGMELGQPVEPNQPHFFEDVYLGEICRNSYSEPWLEEKCHPIDRVNQLRRWAGVQCKEMPKEIGLVCGKHPLLSLMGPEILEAWKEPRFICVARNEADSIESMNRVSWRWHPSAAKYAFEQLRKSREAFFERHRPPLLRILYDEMKSHPKRVVSAICEFLKHDASKEQQESAITLMNNTQDDFCVVSESCPPHESNDKKPPCEKGCTCGKKQ